MKEHQTEVNALNEEIKRWDRSKAIAVGLFFAGLAGAGTAIGVSREVPNEVIQESMVLAYWASAAVSLTSAAVSTTFMFNSREVRREAESKGFEIKKGLLIRSVQAA